jgi:hypothetical protein
MSFTKRHESFNERHNPARPGYRSLHRVDAGDPIKARPCEGRGREPDHDGKRTEIRHSRRAALRLNSATSRAYDPRPNQGPIVPLSGKSPMRQIATIALLTTALIAGPAKAQTGPATDFNTAVPSVLAPRMPDQLPPPTPIEPNSAAQPLPPEGSVPADAGTVTAVPLPPPGPPQPAVLGGTASPVAGAPISLAPPRPPLEPNRPLASSVSTKPGVKPLPGSNDLPTPALSPDASPTDFLRAARGAVAAGRNGEARSALEMAQTRLLDRVVDAGREKEPSRNAAVKQISEAIDALAANDRLACIRYIEFASQSLGGPLD